MKFSCFLDSIVGVWEEAFVEKYEPNTTGFCFSFTQFCWYSSFTDDAHVFILLQKVIALILTKVKFTEARIFPVLLKEISETWFIVIVCYRDVWPEE